MSPAVARPAGSYGTDVYHPSGVMLSSGAHAHRPAGRSGWMDYGSEVSSFILSNEARTTWITSSRDRRHGRHHRGGCAKVALTEGDPTSVGLGACLEPDGLPDGRAAVTEVDLDAGRWVMVRRVVATRTDRDRLPTSAITPTQVVGSWSVALSRLAPIGIASRHPRSPLRGDDYAAPKCSDARAVGLVTRREEEMATHYGKNVSTYSWSIRARRRSSALPFAASLATAVTCLFMSARAAAAVVYACVPPEPLKMSLGTPATESPFTVDTCADAYATTDASSPGASAKIGTQVVVYVYDKSTSKILDLQSASLMQVTVTIRGQRYPVPTLVTWDRTWHYFAFRLNQLSNVPFDDLEPGETITLEFKIGTETLPPLYVRYSRVTCAL
jgi:hypothetical protein